MILFKQYKLIKSSLVFCIISALNTSALFMISTSARADSATIAVASNFLAPAKELARQFEKKSGHEIKISSGSTGKLYAQIINGAPYDVLFAANDREPERLEQQSYVVSGSRFTYALGRLVLWGKEIKGSTHNFKIDLSNFTSLAIANPRTAPYGAAAMSVINRRFPDGAPFRLVRGENVGQVYQYARSGNVPAGFVSLSQVLSDVDGNPDSYWIVPEQEYEPIRQQAVLLVKGQTNKAAMDFLEYIKSVDVQRRISDQYGYLAANNVRVSVPQK